MNENADTTASVFTVAQDMMTCTVKTLRNTLSKMLFDTHAKVKHLWKMRKAQLAATLTRLMFGIARRDRGLLNAANIQMSPAWLNVNHQNYTL